MTIVSDPHEVFVEEEIVETDNNISDNTFIAHIISSDGQSKNKAASIHACMFQGTHNVNVPFYVLY